MEKVKINIEGGDGKNVVAASQWEEGWDMVSHLSDSIEQDMLTDDSTITGHLSVPVASKSEVARVNARFGDVVKVDEALQQFEDREVLNIINENLGKGSPATKEAFAKVTNMPWFQGNGKIVNFEEFGESNVTEIKAALFENCTNLSKIDLSKVLRINSYSQFINATNVEVVSLLSLSYALAISLNKCPKLKAVFLPKVDSCDINCDIAISGDGVVDLGKDFPRFRRAGVYSAAIAKKAKMICRNHVPPTITDSTGGIYGNGFIAYFVPALSLYDYIYHEKWKIGRGGKIFPISGPEWVAEFGSEYAFADVLKYVDDTAEQQKIVDAYEEGHSMTHPMQAKTWALFLGEFSDGMEVSQWRNKVTLHLDTKSPFTEGQWRIVGTGATLEGNVLTIADDADGAEVTLAATSVTDPTKSERVTVKVWDYYHKHERLVADDAVMDVLVKNLGGAALSREQCVAYNGDMRNWFNGNTEIETFEEFGALFPNIDMSIPDTLTNSVFRDCINLRKVNCDSINIVTGYMFYNTPKLQENICFLNALETRNYAFQGSGAKRVFMPKLEACEYMTFRTWENAELIDLGSNLKSLAYYNIWMLTANPLCVCRAAVPPIGNSANGGLIEGSAFGSARVVFVPVGKTSAYEAAMTPSSRSQFTGHFAEIGGTEWIAEFGSADEYADIDKYVTDPVEAEKIKAAYRDAATA